MIATFILFIAATLRGVGLLGYFAFAWVYLALVIAWGTVATEFFLNYWLSVALHRAVDVSVLTAFFCALFFSALTVPGALLTLLLQLMNIL